MTVWHSRLPTKIKIPSSENLTASLFLFRTPLDAARCIDLTPASDCANLEDCQVKLGPQSFETNNDGSDLVIDFTANGDCQFSQHIDTIHYPEACDNFDNDCDGRIDEDVIIDAPCQETQSDGCAIRGQRVCGPNGTQICDTTNVGDPCNGVDDDCDAIIDEDQTCQTCRTSTDCDGDFHCKDMSVCVECITNDDCSGSLICRANENICSPCRDDSECTNGMCARGLATNADGSECSDSNCTQNRCAECDPARAETGCGIDQVCDPESGICRGCQTDNECLSGQSCVIELGDNSGLCAECNPNADATNSCADGKLCLDRRETGGRIQCEYCQNDADCDTGQFCINRPHQIRRAPAVTVIQTSRPV